MILVDFSQVMISNIMMQLHHNNEEVDESLVRHMVLNSLRAYRQKFGEYGEMVMCCDSRSYWRREYFPQYKAGRKKAREKSSIDWNAIFNALHTIRDELAANMPYPVLRIEGAEADDIIGVLCKQNGMAVRTNDNDNNIMIISADKDFVQLHRYANVEQYSPIQKKMVVETNPDRYRKMHILQGDSGDGVPNFLSPDNTFVDGIRQKPISKKKMEDWLTMAPEEFCEGEMLRNYMRNKKMVDFDEIPEHLQNEIVDEYANAVRNSRGKILNYFIENRLKTLTESIGEF
jgi:5'-3' exonuclease